MNSLISKYNVAGPRYTSYPTVPYWDEEGIAIDKWKASVKKSFEESNAKEGISLYIHLPFCENLCTFCGCNKRITKNHDVEFPYIEALLKEWQLYLTLFEEKPIIAELHFGGGTPTFFSAENLDHLLSHLFENAEKAHHHVFSFEGHPNNTTREHLDVMAKHGFKRASYGVQDLDPVVQRAINRVQPFENVLRVHEESINAGYNSISFDLVYGLPHQHLDSVKNTIEKVRTLKPERIAFYSYAHVPWIKGNGQRGFDENDLPKSEEKRALYESGYQLLLESGYKEIGMDHFALPHDDLYVSMQNKKLHRNFMGYTASKTQLMVGLGVSSIGDSWYAFAQNVKSVEGYYSKLAQNEFPIFRGHLLNDEDLLIRKHILNLMCHFETEWDESNSQNTVLQEAKGRLAELEADGLVKLHGNGLSVTEEGKAFVRNICMAFDLRLMRKKPSTQLFSMTI
ncbi:MAG: oxygen-independent coproporphyrinogen III oxidase [Verrucomicrobia bacterium]|nr:oxygen-independent coproporphyrinogen III oxidase [Verrucomicrobiota bacterium]